jgi:hypothetical protein
MGKLNDVTATREPIGREGLARLCDELNGMRVRAKMPPQYVITEAADVWQLHDCKTDGPLRGRVVWPR